MVCIIVFAVLALPAFAASDYDYSRTNLSNDFDDQVFLVGDNINISINITDISTGVSIPSDTICVINFSGDAYQMSYTNGFFWQNYTFTETSNTYQTSCNGSDQTNNLLELDERYSITLLIPLSPMQSVSLLHNVTLIEYNLSHNPIETGSCTFNISGNLYPNLLNNDSFTHTYQSAGDVPINYTCTFPISGPVNGSFPARVTAYEPQLFAPQSNPLASHTSATNYKLGAFDFDGDRTDELIIVEDSGLFVLNGTNLSQNFAESIGGLFINTQSFFATDLDWDGDGDLLIQNGTRLYKLSYDAGSFSMENIGGTFTSLSAFGTFEINNDFYKDVIVLNGSGNTWQYTLFKGTSSGFVFNETGLLSLGAIENSCDKMLIFDFDKDAIQEIVCQSSKDSGSVLLFDRDSYTESLSGMVPSIYPTGFTPMTAVSHSMFFADVDSDGEWELGVVETGNSHVHYFKNLSTTFDELMVDTLGTSSFGGHAAFDVMHNDTLNRHYTLSSGGIYLSTWYEQNVSNTTDLSYFGSPMYVQNNGATDVVVSYFDSGYKLAYLKNNISVFVSQPTEYTALMLLKNYSIVEESAYESSLVDMSFSPSATWPYHDYFFSVEFIGTDSVYRNDYFDSQQNLKYFLINDSNTYQFDVPNDNEYEVTFALNRFSMSLTTPTLGKKENDDCLCFFTDSCSIQTTCEIDTGSAVTFSASTINITNARVLWDTVRTNATIHLRNLTSGTNFIRDSYVFNTTLNIENGTTLLIRNTTFVNTTIVIANISVSLTDTTITGLLIVNGSKNTTITSTTIQNLSTASSFAGTVKLNNSQVDTALYANGSIRYFNSSDSDVLNTGANQTYYNCTTFTLLDDVGASLVLTGTDSYGTPFSSSACLPIRDNVSGTQFTNYSYVFTFDTDYQYYPTSQNFTLFGATTQIALNRTFLPVWDYTLNGSFQTDFRNYSLLQSVGSLSDIRLSYGEFFNVTVLGSHNYSSLNLTAFLYAGAATFSIANTLGNETLFDVNVSYPHASVVITPDANLSIGNGKLSGEVLSGSYQIQRDLVTQVAVPKYAYPNVSFDVDVVYENLNGSLNGVSGCSFFVSDTEVGFTGLTFTSAGSYPYQANCSYPGLEDISYSGFLNVSASYLSGFESALTHTPFVVRNNHPIDCTGNITFTDVESFEEKTFEFNSSCEASVLLSEYEYNYTAEFDSFSENGSISLGQGFIFFANVFEIVRLGVGTSDSQKNFNIINTDSFITYRSGLNLSSYNMFSKDDGLTNKEIPPQSTFYYKGVLFNDGKVIEITN